MQQTTWLRRVWVAFAAPYKGPGLPQELGNDCATLATCIILVALTGTFPLGLILAIIAARFVGMVIGGGICAHRKGIAVSSLPRKVD